MTVLSRLRDGYTSSDESIRGLRPLPVEHIEIHLATGYKISSFPLSSMPLTALFILLCIYRPRGQCGLANCSGYIGIVKLFEILHPYIWLPY